MSTVSIRTAFARFWWLGLLVFLLCAALGVGLAMRQDEKFTATATVLVSPSPELGANVQGIRYLLPSLSQQVDTAENFQATQNALPPGAQDAPWDVTVTTNAETLVLSVAAESERKDVVVDVANAFANQIVSQKGVVPPVGDGLVVFSLLEPASSVSSTASAQRVMIVAGIGLGLVLGFLVMLSAQALRPSVRRPEDLRRLRIGVMGEIPTEGGLEPPARVFGNDGPAADAYERAAVGVEAARQRAGRASVAILSLESGEGASAVAAGLAWASASMGHRVAIVDADLGAPQLHRRLGLEVTDGLSDGGDPRAVPGAPAGLRAVVAGTPAANPLETVNTRLPDLLSDIEGAGATALVDTPALAAGADSVVIASLVGAAVLVIRAGRHRPDAVQRAVADLEASGVYPLGVVMTEVKGRRNGRRSSAARSAAPATKPVDASTR